MNNKIIISLISLFIVLGVVFFLVIPLWSSVRDARADLSELEQEQVEIEGFLIKSRQIERTYWEFEEEARKVFSALPEGGSMPYLLIQFEDVVRENGLLLGGIKFNQSLETTDQRSRQKTVQLLSEDSYQEGRMPAGVSNLLANINASGSYESFKSYLNSLERSIYPMNIEQISLKSQTENRGDIFGDFGIFQFDLKINTYFRSLTE